jgi:hypothetical protein
LDARQDCLAEIQRCIRAANARRRDQKLLDFLDRFKTTSGAYCFVGKLTAKTMGNWRLGDVLIALETPVGACIYTTDGHYDALCLAVRSKRFGGYLPRSISSAQIPPESS